jgi:alpha-tubulin suppressor-like RCC1 family protein
MSRGPGMESCEGSADEDCDGAVDEGCSCTEGASRPCTGPSEGACSAGTQACRGGAWTSCEGAVGPVAEVCSNGVDDDCDGISDDPSFCSCSPVPEVCGNGVDDDCDGETDESPCTTPTLDAGMPDAGMPTPEDAGVVGDPIVEVAAGGRHTCAHRSSGRVLCWGSNYGGQLGDGTTEDRLAPTTVVDLSDAVQIQAGLYHTCARRRDGSVVCWGDNTLGQIGDGTCSNRSVGCPAGADRLRPTPVAGLADAVEIAVGVVHTCARRGDGHVFCWGSNDAGAIGDGTCSSRVGPVSAFGPQPACSGTDRWSPTEVMGLTDAVEITAGGAHTCARRASGEVLCWGGNLPGGISRAFPLGSGGAVGDGTTTNRLVPTPVLGLTGAVQLTTGATHSCALRAGGDVACWGGNFYGGLGDGTTMTRLVPTPVPALADVVEIRASRWHTCARLGSGGVRCWGANDQGQVGDDTFVDLRDGGRVAPTDVVDLVDAASLTTRGNHNCALRRDGTIVCWGQNSFGQLGDGTDTNRPAPRAVRGL